MKNGYVRQSDDEFVNERLRAIKSLFNSLLEEAVDSYNPMKTDGEFGIDYYAAVAQYETDLINTALIISGGRQKDAAKLLNLGTSTLSTKMKRLNIPCGMPAKFQEA